MFRHHTEQSATRVFENKEKLIIMKEQRKTKRFTENRIDTDGSEIVLIGRIPVINCFFMKGCVAQPLT